MRGSAQYHTPLPALWTATSADWNSRVGDLDATIYGVMGGELPWSERDAAPPRPPEGFVHVYVNEDKTISYIDDDLTVTAVSMENPEEYAMFAHVITSTSTGNALLAGDWRLRNINSDESNEYGWGSAVKLNFILGGSYELKVGDILSGTYGIPNSVVLAIDLTSGNWRSGNAAGSIWVGKYTVAYPYIFPTNFANTPAQENICLITSVETGGIRLTAGTYRAKAWGEGRIVGVHQMRLYDTTNAATLITGQNADSGDGYSVANLVGTFTLADTAVVQLEHQCTVNGGQWAHWGTPGVTYQYGSVLELWKDPAS